MPQLDIILWFSQTFWFLLFSICFISFVFILYIPISCFVEGLPFYKKKDHYTKFNNFFFFLFVEYSRFFLSKNSLIINIYILLILNFFIFKN
jgi:hypothetical protein